MQRERCEGFTRLPHRPVVAAWENCAMEILLAYLFVCGLGLAIVVAIAYRVIRAAVRDGIDLADIRRRKALAQLAAEEPRR
jgi:hypothetical protein